MWTARAITSAGSGSVHGTCTSVSAPASIARSAWPVPWTEELPAGVIARAAHMTWISTLAIHDGPGGSAGPALAHALANARRFVAAGGRLVYGTDLGNGPAPAGVNEREIELLGTVLTGEALRRAVLGPVDAVPALAAPLPVPETASDLIAWLDSGRRVPLPPR